MFKYEQRNLKIIGDPICPVTPYSVFLLDFFPPVKDLNILDYGFGSGVLAIYAALNAARKVVAIDKNPHCLVTAQNNSMLNCTENVDFRIIDGKDILNGFHKTFDIIVSNPASLPSDKKLPLFFDSGLYGTDMIFELISNSKNLLKDNGQLFFILTSLVPKKMIEEFLSNNGFDFFIYHSRVIPFRDVYNPILSYLLKLREDNLIFFEKGGT